MNAGVQVLAYQYLHTSDRGQGQSQQSRTACWDTRPRCMLSCTTGGYQSMCVYPASHQWNHRDEMAGLWSDDQRLLCKLQRLPNNFSSPRGTCVNREIFILFHQSALHKSIRGAPLSPSSEPAHCYFIHIIILDVDRTQLGRRWYHPDILFTIILHPIIRRSPVTFRCQGLPFLFHTQINQG